jgi:hypothetical protein
VGKAFFSSNRKVLGQGSHQERREVAQASQHDKVGRSLEQGLNRALSLKGISGVRLHSVADLRKPN